MRTTRRSLVIGSSASEPRLKAHAQAGAEMPLNASEQDNPFIGFFVHKKRKIKKRDENHKAQPCNRFERERAERHEAIHSTSVACNDNIYYVKIKNLPLQNTIYVFCSTHSLAQRTGGAQETSDLLFHSYRK